MKFRSLLSRNIGGLILSVAAAQSAAGPMELVELTGQVGFSCGTGTGGFEGHCRSGENIESGPFRLVYDPLIPDTDHGANSGLFRGAIRSFVMTVSQINRPALHFSLVGRGDLHRHFTGGLDFVTWRMALEEENGIVGPSMFSFQLYQLTWGDPNRMPTIDFWPVATGLVADGGGVGETDWLYSGRITAQSVPRPVPAPPSLWLLLIGGAAALLQRRRPWKT